MTEKAARRAGATTNGAAARLRTEILARPDGACLGNDEAVQKLLGVSRPTMRQAALLLEGEGLLKVRRGNNGGYFGTRPDLDFISTTVSSYLETVSADLEDLTAIASVLWVEAVRKAAGLKNAEIIRQARLLHKKMSKIDDTVGFTELHAIDGAIQNVVFHSIDSPYVGLIFKINADFARRRIAVARAEKDVTDEHRAFVPKWLGAKLLELQGIGDGDTELAVLGAQRARDLYNKRVWL